MAVQFPFRQLALFLVLIGVGSFLFYRMTEQYEKELVELQHQLDLIVEQRDSLKSGVCPLNCSDFDAVPVPVTTSPPTTPCPSPAPCPTPEPCPTPVVMMAPSATAAPALPPVPASATPAPTSPTPLVSEAGTSCAKGDSSLGVTRTTDLWGEMFDAHRDKKKSCQDFNLHTPTDFQESEAPRLFAWQVANCVFDIVDSELDMLIYENAIPQEGYDQKVVYYTVIHYAADTNVIRNWASWLRRLGIEKFVVGAVTSDAFEYCKRNGLAAYHGYSMIREYPYCNRDIDVMHRDSAGLVKARMAYEFIRRGVTALYSDIDTLWFKPFPVQQLLNVDVAFTSVDSFTCGVNDEAAGGNIGEVCFGQWAVRATPKAAYLLLKQIEVMIGFGGSPQGHIACDDQYVFFMNFWNKRWEDNSAFCAVHYKDTIQYLKGHENCATVRVVHHCEFPNFATMAKSHHQPGFMGGVVALHMTQFFCQHTKYHWLKENMVWLGELDSYYTTGKYLTYSDKSGDQRLLLIAALVLAEAMGRILIMPTFTHPSGRECTFEWVFFNHILRPFTYREYSFLRHPKVKLTPVDVEITDGTSFPAVAGLATLYADQDLVHFKKLPSLTQIPDELQAKYEATIEAPVCDPYNAYHAYTCPDPNTNLL